MTVPLQAVFSTRLKESFAVISSPVTKQKTIHIWKLNILFCFLLFWEGKDDLNVTLMWLLTLVLSLSPASKVCIYHFMIITCLHLKSNFPTGNLSRETFRPLDWAFQAVELNRKSLNHFNSRNLFKEPQTFTALYTEFAETLLHRAPAGFHLHHAQVPTTVASGRLPAGLKIWRRCWGGGQAPHSWGPPPLFFSNKTHWWNVQSTYYFIILVDIL